LLFLVPDGLTILVVAILPKVFQLLDPHRLVFEFSAAFFEEDPFQLMVRGKDYFEKHYGSCIDSNRNQNDPFSRLSRHEEVDVEEDESQNCVIEQPISNKGDFFN
jgi:hypothetical protein